MNNSSSQTHSRPFRLALIGNPNSGKSSVFNRLTGLQQKVGNFPGVTVDKKLGSYELSNGEKISLIDFPGAYSFYPSAQDERIVVQTLANPLDENYPDAILYVADFTRLEKHLLLFTQIKDLGLPAILGLNMADMAEERGREVDTALLSKKIDAPVVVLSSHSGEGFQELEGYINQLTQVETSHKTTSFYRPNTIEKRVALDLEQAFPNNTVYQNILLAHHYQWLPFLSDDKRQLIERVTEEHDFKTLRHQVQETMARFDQFEPVAKATIKETATDSPGFTEKVDRILTHKVFGPLIFLLLMLFVFQAIYAWAGYPMDGIEWIFGQLNDVVKAVLPAGWLTDLLTDGILAGLGGVVIFIPQIAILFFLINLLEEVGYMARAAYMFDSLMHFFGLNGRSLVALISSGACAIPAIMSTRTIANWKERLITILVAPFISCSARLPVYVVLIGFVVPAGDGDGFFNPQGLAFMGLYLLGIIAALGTALFFKYILKTEERSTLMLELPEYRRPLLRNVTLNVWDKVRSFVIEAGKVILVISIVLWALASYGPADKMAAVEAQTATIATAQNLDANAKEDLEASLKLEASYAGQMGKYIEPVIRPLGFDWKMGVAIICSFAAREVFVGTMATLYSVGSAADDESGIIERLTNERNPVTGEQVYTTATSASLLIFYVFAMMCMSTLAVVKRETKSWKWPIFQFFLMTGIAYLASFAVYQWLA
ncbi:ferrous iron transport protein B [Lewinella cohaerens]|uniref:ferrous iron transport protein B n=1 Tax=Lewinella cohaerens TaxID=70995 RepID=UPI0003822612|nr:ferrous iron transport protein B [Lewinella cohaerens]